MNRRANSADCRYASDPRHHCRDSFGNDLFEGQTKPCYYELAAQDRDEQIIILAEAADLITLAERIVSGASA